MPWHAHGSARRLTAWTVTLVAAFTLLAAAPARAADPQSVTVTFTQVGDWYETTGGPGVPNQYRVDVTAADGTAVTGLAVRVYIDGQASGFADPVGTVMDAVTPVVTGVNDVSVQFYGLPGTYAVGSATAQVVALPATVPAQVTFSVPPTAPAESTTTIPVDVAAGGAPAAGSISAVYGGGASTGVEVALVDGHADLPVYFGPVGTSQIAIAYSGGAGAQPVTTEAQPTTVTTATLRVLAQPVVAGVPVVGAAVSAQVADAINGVAGQSIWDRQPDRVDYQWIVGGVSVAGATNPDYVVPASAIGKSIQVRMTAHLQNYFDSTLTSGPSAAVRDSDTQVQVQGHVQGVGWQPWTTSGAMVGTTGRSLRLEAFHVRLANAAYTGGITASVHVQGLGWMAPVTDGGVVGTTGRGLPIEAVKLQLTGEMATHFSLWYRVHVSGIGWMGWGEDGGPAGTEGLGDQVEALDVRLLPKGDPVPPSTASRGQYVGGRPPDVSSWISNRAHVQSIGWQPWTAGGTTIGTTGRGLRMEAVQFQIGDADYTGGITASAHVQTLGWMAPVAAGGIVGTTGKGLRLEALKVQLTGDMATHFDVYYRAHVQGFGWLGWAANGQPAGSAGYGYRMEALQVRLVDKGDAAPAGNGMPAFEQH
ncbi:MAG: hypothetical protein FWF90_17265 [Promicromonosporaceae bacterium]|nr:hypothetical protein [Promicromonosporaceae bacterium]